MQVKISLQGAYRVFDEFDDKEITKNQDGSFTVTTSLPEAITTYFQASNSYDSNLLAKCFAEDAILYDDGQNYHGPSAIKAHIIVANNDLLVKTDITNAIEKNSEMVIIATLSGNFDGSPVALDYYFTMKDQKIVMLKIILAGD
ncbi:nuclear transport factor 2 family protein [Leuconostoc gasicomitatum]|uniref:nuclear transport factor 2 family protein n=1 Tax=Leuconostoc gasicomitatum TaxID=115778 RepID=UPI001CC33F1B|nr:nuclear transport factor 2 family protein [Leuconostoc gasicomitatum]